MPEGYVAVSHIVSNLVKKTPLRLSSCWTPVSGSFESIVEEDEELNDDKELETTNSEPGTHGLLVSLLKSNCFLENGVKLLQARSFCIFYFFIVGNTEGSSSSQKVDFLVRNEKPTQVTFGHGTSAPEVFSDSRDSNELCDSSLTQSLEPASHSLTFVTPSCNILTETPRASPIKPQPSTLTYPPSSIDQTPLSAEGAGDEIASEEKPPCEEKHVTSTPYLEFDSMMESNGLRDSAKDTQDGISQSDNTFVRELGMTEFYHEFDLGLSANVFA